MIPVLAEHVHPEWEDFGTLEWVIVVAATLVVIWSIYKTVRYTIQPGEQDPDHVKRIIFEATDAPSPEVSSDRVEDAPRE